MINGRKLSLALASLAALGLAAAHPAQAQTTLFTDNFNSPDSTAAQGGINTGVGTAGRQSGTDVPTGGLTYRQKGAVGNQAAIAGGQFSSATGVNAYGTPDHDFFTDYVGTRQTPSLTYSLQFANAGNFAFFDLSNTPLTFANGNNSFGIAFNNSAGTGQVFVGSPGGTDNGTFPEFTFTPAANGALNNLVVTLTANTAGTADAINVMLNGAALGATNTNANGSFLLGTGGNGTALTNNYLTFGAEFGPAATFDHVRVVANNLAAAPEPSQSAALGLGVLGLAGLIFTARKRSRLSA